MDVAQHWVRWEVRSRNSQPLAVARIRAYQRLRWLGEGVVAREVGRAVVRVLVERRAAAASFALRLELAAGLTGLDGLGISRRQTPPTIAPGGFAVLDDVFQAVARRAPRDGSDWAAGAGRAVRVTRRRTADNQGQECGKRGSRCHGAHGPRGESGTQN